MTKGETSSLRFIWLVITNADVVLKIVKELKTSIISMEKFDVVLAVFCLSYACAVAIHGAQGGDASWPILIGMTGAGAVVGANAIGLVWEIVIRCYEQQRRRQDEVIKQLMSDYEVALDQRNELAKDLQSLIATLARHGIRVIRRRRTLH